MLRKTQAQHWSLGLDLGLDKAGSPAVHGCGGGRAGAIRTQMREQELEGEGGKGPRYKWKEAHEGDTSQIKAATRTQETNSPPTTGTFI